VLHLEKRGKDWLTFENWADSPSMGIGDNTDAGRPVMTKTKSVIIPILIVALGVGIYLFFAFKDAEKEFRLIPKETVAKKHPEVQDSQVSTGWSSKEDPGEAIEEALNMALQGKTDKSPDLVIIFASSGSDMRAILSGARRLLGMKTKIYGGTSDSRAVMTDKGYVRAAKEGYDYSSLKPKTAVAVMTVASHDIVFGVGSARCSDHPSVPEASKAAILSAIRNAGKSPSQLPRLVLVTAPRSLEEETISGIEEIIGKGTPLIGGTAGGPSFAVFGESEVYDVGISLLVLYTDLPVGWIYEGGFDVTDKNSGIVTEVEGPAIAKINNRPALDVYDEWLEGHIERLFQQVGDIASVRTLLTLHPLYRRYTSRDGQEYFLFSHPWPKDATLKDRSIMTSTKIKVGERIYLSHGTWETFLNRIGNLPRNARVRGGIPLDSKPLLGVGYICAGVLGVIPQSERDKMSVLMNYTNDNAPFVAAFTWGEQGHFPGMGNQHGNLLTSFVVIGTKVRQ
jgi:hypothetical protein